jgi:hypothetical protein
MATKTPLTEWSRETVGGILPHLPRLPQDLHRYAVLSAYVPTGDAPVGECLSPELPETGTTLAPGAPLAWAIRRAEILANRADADARRVERALTITDRAARCKVRPVWYGHNPRSATARFMVGTDAEKADRDRRAYGVTGYGRLHVDR